MSKDYKSLLEYKKSSGDWHYDPSIPSSDSQYIGRIVDLDFSKIKSKLEEKESEHAVELYEDDFKDGTLIPSQLSPNSVGASKLDHIENGYNKHNSRYTQWIDNRDNLPIEFETIKDISGLNYATIACFKQDPGNTNPWHFDTYQGAVGNKGNISENDRHKIQRYLLFLEDWHWGHFLQVGNNVLFHWKAGDIYTWKYGMYHLSTNGGIKPKWTCQITGYPTENSLHKSSKFKFKIGE